MWRGDELERRFAALDALLAAHRAWWQPRAFCAPVLPWEAAHPALAQALRTLSLPAAEAIAADNDALYGFFADAPCAELAAAASVLKTCGAGPLPARALPDGGEARDVPGRKWRQILAFARALPDLSLPAVEWCAGKAHLGRHYARGEHAAVDALEWQRALVDDGNRIAQRERLPVRCHHVDVLAPAAGAFLPGRRVLALHACGQLHLQLLQVCAQALPRAVALAPCCYHLQPDDIYAPLSPRARRSALALTRLDLHTAVQENVTSPPRVQRQRRQLQAWRLGFDALQRDVRGVDLYLPTPPLPLSVLKAGFADFCAALAARKGIELPAFDAAAYEATGWRRLAEVAALDLPRLLFRRALESWLVLDRALWLQGLGYDVSVGTFCERALTPRNLLLLAQRR